MSDITDATPAEREVARRVARIALACREAGGLVLAALEQPELYARLLANVDTAPSGAFSAETVAASPWEGGFAEAAAAEGLLPDAPTPEEHEAADAVEAALPDEPEGASEAAPDGALFRAPEDVAVEDAAAGWRPSPDQEAALAALLTALETPGTYVLTGAAGCGKTTVLRALLRRLTPQWGVTLLAPTWRAALRMREVIGQDARSIHSAVYGKPTEQRRCTCGTWSKELMRHVDRYFEVDEQDRPVGSGVEDAEPGRVKLPRYVCPSCAAQHEDAALLPHRLDFEGKAKAEGPEGGRALVVIDEASMVAAREVRAVASAFDGVETRILYVGDANQLDPVEDGDAPGAPPEAASPEAAALPDLLHPTAALHTVHRQAGDSPILRIAHALKSVPVPSTAEWPFPARASGVDVRLKAPLAEVADWAARHRCAGSDVALIACSNKTRARLNAAVRATTGAARVAGGALIPGDRLLSRTNSKAGLFNGELWTLCTIERVPAGTALLDHRGRAPVKHPRYEHDRVLSYGVGVWRVELAAVGAEGHRAHALIVAPVAEHGGPVLESDLILHANYEPRTARQACREIARCWASEYAAAVSAMELEYQEARSGALYKRVAEARLLTYLAARDFAGIKARYAVLERYAPKGVHGSLPRIAALLDMTPEARAQAIRAFDRPEDAAAECATVAEYARRVYGALDPARVGVLDYGEALTCHAMQGSQAAHVGVVFDSGFWGMWRHERAAGLKWAYTAVTRAAEQLALFSIRKEGA